MEKRNILITGGAGFIGSHVVELMTTKYPHYHIVTLDKLTYAGSLDNIAEAMKRPNHTFIEGDICDKELVERIFAEHHIDGVMHLAAESHVDRSISAPMLFAMNNILGTITLLEAARKAWTGNYEGKRFHHISTASRVASISSCFASSYLLLATLLSIRASPSLLIILFPFLRLLSSALSFLHTYYITKENKSQYFFQISFYLL